MTETNGVDPQALSPGWFIDSEHADIEAFSRRHRGKATDAPSMAIALYLAVRDKIRYDPYSIRPEPDSFRASAVLDASRGHCVGKSVLYAAVLRSAGVPSRIGFADVRNHLTTPQLRSLMGTDMFYHHGYSEVYLNGRWLKATPAFNLSLCKKFGIRPLEFDGTKDSIFHPFDSAGRQHMEYVNDHGPHCDLPYDEMIAVYRRHYPAMFAGKIQALDGDFEAEATAE